MDRFPPTEAELAAREASAPEPPLDPRILDSDDREDREYDER